MDLHCWKPSRTGGANICKEQLRSSQAFSRQGQTQGSLLAFSSSSELKWPIQDYKHRLKCTAQVFRVPMLCLVVVQPAKTWSEGATLLYFPSSNHCCLGTRCEYKRAAESWVRALGKPRRVGGTMTVFPSIKSYCLLVSLHSYLSIQTAEDNYFGKAVIYLK